MRVDCPNSATLRGEARVLAIAGTILLALGFPPTIFLAAQALTAGAVSPFLPAAVGAAPLMLGYLACHFASRRLVRARAIEDR